MLRFDIGDIPVRVHFSFLVIAFFGPRRDFEGIVVWTIAVFLAVLAHEAGHAFTARAYGIRSVSITLFALGGATMFPATAELTPGKRFVISAAGSAVGIVLGGIVGLLWLNGGFDDSSPIVRLAAISFMWAALGWGILNWIPIRPLDGGQMLTSALEIVAPQRGSAIARVISGIVGATIVVVAFAYDQTFLAFFVAFITVVGLRADPAPPDTGPARDTATGESVVAEDPASFHDVGQEPDHTPEPPSFPI